ncbi:hypothetical protein [Streptomyces sp. NPDC017260]|uniref:hypothetical protein n=1 Tax=unclassified Streptomyces TaxID=2593676 RepID=UPI00379A060E
MTITAALSDGRQFNCPQLSTRERAQIRKHQRRAARAPKGSDRRRAENAKVAKRDDACPHLRLGAVRETERQEHDRFREGDD